MTQPNRRLALASLLALAGPVFAQRNEQPVIEQLKVGTYRIELQFAPGFSATERALASQWVQRSAQTVAAYFGRYPVNGGEILLVPKDGSGVSGGTTFNAPGPTVRVNLGRDTAPAYFQDDWVMVHEMVHLAIPYLPRRNSWFHEGAATYVEIIARAHAGLTTADSVWLQLPRNLHQGLPQAGDRGLDFTPSWGRTYWGGAMFCLLADVEIRKRSGNRYGLRDGFRGLVASGSNYGVALGMDETLARIDKATGNTVLAELYADMRDKPVTPDLPQLWKDLGVDILGRSVTLRDDAPLSATRRAITSSTA
jgi:hypothetical protein